MNDDKKERYPVVRITPRAHAHLKKIVAANSKKRGAFVSGTNIASDAILALPMPRYRKQSSDEVQDE